MDWIWPIFDFFLIKRSKRWHYCWFKDQKSPISSKSWYILTLSIDFKLFDIFRTDFDRIHCDNIYSDNKFRSEKSIKSQLESDFSQNFALGRFNHLSLVCSHIRRLGLCYFYSNITQSSCPKTVLLENPKVFGCFKLVWILETCCSPTYKLYILYQTILHSKHK